MNHVGLIMFLNLSNITNLFDVNIPLGDIICKQIYLKANYMACNIHSNILLITSSCDVNFINLINFVIRNCSSYSQDKINIVNEKIFSSKHRCLILYWSCTKMYMYTTGISCTFQFNDGIRFPCFNVYNLFMNLDFLACSYLNQ